MFTFMKILYKTTTQLCILIALVYFKPPYQFTYAIPIKPFKNVENFTKEYHKPKIKNLISQIQLHLMIPRSHSQEHANYDKDVKIVNHVKYICSNHHSKILSILKNLHLSFCDYSKLNSVMDHKCKKNLQKVNYDISLCESCIFDIFQKDHNTESMYDGMKSLISRSKCNQPYSIYGNCDLCLKAYKKWLCKVNIPFYQDEMKIEPCSQAITQIMQSICPHFKASQDFHNIGSSIFTAKFIYQDRKENQCYSECQISVEKVAKISRCIID
ncbi:hypothetical protein A3Q56_06341 [Intoshia linei]|uniref:Uncharacterized protein n=1 Tax=Intoshia linei TaxID=1819745 RepID=A0A177AVA1_9BILA|nr:hypothetical protein A3Q56_06341 [Intoshia linei]